MSKDTYVPTDIEQEFMDAGMDLINECDSVPCRFITNPVTTMAVSTHPIRQFSLTMLIPEGDAKAVREHIEDLLMRLKPCLDAIIIAPCSEPEPYVPEGGAPIIPNDPLRKEASKIISLYLQNFHHDIGNAVLDIHAKRFTIEQAEEFYEIKPKVLKEALMVFNECLELTRQELLLKTDP